VANGLNPNTTPVKACMRKPLVAIEGDRTIIDAVRMIRNRPPGI
ncbi:MAG: signal transduction protein, partial [Nitrospirales bacterium]|nr:signal transduction protein [Nitrospirales bacterium]